MDDLISRQALCEYALNQKDKSVTLNDIMRFPSAEPDWIPCSEKHPDKDGWYLVSLGNEWDENGFGRVNADKKIYDSMVRISSYKNGSWFHGMVAAWMPMPNAYKGEKE